MCLFIYFQYACNFCYFCVILYFKAISSDARALSANIDALFDNQISNRTKLPFRIDIYGFSQYPDFLAFAIIALSTGTTEKILTRSHRSFRRIHNSLLLLLITLEWRSLRRNILRMVWGSIASLDVLDSLQPIWAQIHTTVQTNVSPATLLVCLSKHIENTVTSHSIVYNDFYLSQIKTFKKIVSFIILP